MKDLAYTQKYREKINTINVARGLPHSESGGQIY